MKAWFTRPDAADLISKGVSRCEIWLAKPFFDVTPRGAELDKRFADSPLGWRVLHADYGDISGDVSLEVRCLSVEDEAVLNRLWEAVALSIDGQPAPRTPSELLDRWERFRGEDCVDHGKDSFLFEAEIPPAMWWDAANRNGLHVQTAQGRFWQNVWRSDLPF